MTTRLIDIDDADDPRLDDFRDLTDRERRPDGPGGRGLVVAEGAFVCEHLLASARFRTRAVLVTPKAAERRTALLRAAAGIPCLRVPEDVFDRVVGFHFHRGVMAVADRPAPLDPGEILEGARTVAVLEGLNDHENIGAIFRNAAGLGVDAVLIGAGCADPLYRRAVRVSMGHVLRVPFAHLEGGRSDWQRSLEGLRRKGFRLVSLTPDPGAASLADACHGADRVAFLLGAEGPGLTEHAMRATDVRARIPMTPGTDSLNVATAAAIAFYERARGSVGATGGAGGESVG